MSSTKRKAGKAKRSAARKPGRVIVVGAGVAGLAAGRALREARVPFVILEARDRIGGRIWTNRPRTLDVPVELGAEFTHGEAEETVDIADENHLRLVDIGGRRFWSAGGGGGRGGAVRPLDDFWERLDRVMRRLDEERSPDRTFADALAANKMIGDDDRTLALQYVSGFHAANPEIISERALAEGGSPRGEVRERRIGRVLDGYDAIVAALLDGIRGNVRLRSVVKSIRWEAGRVSVSLAGGGSVTGSAAIVTVPLGVLAAPSGEKGAIAFDPELPPATISAIDDMTMGSVSRLCLEFDEPFWISERVATHLNEERLDTMSFLHGSSDVDYPVWWTTYPVRSPLLVAWCGGPHAIERSALLPNERQDRAIASLAKLLSMDPRTVREHHVATYEHNWQSDPFSRGAYSYARVGGDEAAKRLARPVAGTLYFAGEHADVGGRNGTVHGAIATGRHAVELLINKQLTEH